MQIETFHIVGIQVKTKNADNRAAQDIGGLWGRLYQEGIAQQIPNRLSDTIYAVYSDYESDHNGYYTMTLGYTVADLNTIPNTLSGKTIEPGTYTPFLAKGTMPMPIIEAWQKIWSMDKDLNRSYATDYEVYDEKASQGDQSEATIFIGVNA